MKNQISNKCYCAFCRSPRRVYMKRHFNSMNVLLATLTSLLLMFILWQRPDPRVLVLFVASLAGCELFIQLRWRLTITCPHCGFDPVTYKKSPEKAAAKVKEFFDGQKESSDFFLRRNPLLDIARRRKSKQRKKDSNALSI